MLRLVSLFLLASLLPAQTIDPIFDPFVEGETVYVLTATGTPGEVLALNYEDDAGNARAYRATVGPFGTAMFYEVLPFIGASSCELKLRDANGDLLDWVPMKINPPPFPVK